MKKEIISLLVLIANFCYITDAQDSNKKLEICDFIIPDATKKVLIDVTKDYSLFRLKSNIVSQKIDKLLQLKKEPEMYHWIIGYCISILELNTKDFNQSQNYFDSA